MEIQLKLQMTTMPNFISIDGPFVAVPHHKEKPKIAVGELSPEQAQEYGEAMKQAFLDHWSRKKTEPKGPAPRKPALVETCDVYIKPEAEGLNK